MNGHFLIINDRRETESCVEIRTHKEINRTLCGTPVKVEENGSRVRLQTNRDMAVDETGLVHGGFIFGLADHAAMIAVNHPNVVLAGAEVKFIKPVAAGATVVAEAVVESGDDRKKDVTVSVDQDGETVFEGRFRCVVLNRHVLS